MFTLNSSQEEAINHSEGPVIIIAGAGTGKTSVITEKILHLINHKQIPAKNILALTFSKKACFEMQERIEKSLPFFNYDLDINTFHGFCNDVLQKYGFHIGISSNFTLLDNVGQILFLQKIFNKLELKYYYSLSNQISLLMNFSRFFSRCKDEMVNFDDFKKYVENEELSLNNRINELSQEDKEIEISRMNELNEQAKVYKIYQKELIKSNYLNFNDLIVFTIELFKSKQNVLAKFQERYKYILVDEFQDTNIAQIELLKLLSIKYRNITVVGDDDQSIYHFRGASYSSFTKFSEIFPELKKITLNINYRSTKKILALANEVISLNQESRFDPNKKLITDNEDGEKNYILTSDDFLFEAKQIAEEIKKIVSNNVELKDIAVLYRSHSHKDKLIQFLKSENLPFYIKTSMDLFEQSEVKDVISIIKVINNPDDSVNLFRFISMDIWDFSWDDKLCLNKIAKDNKLSLFEIMDFDERIKNVFINVKKFITVFYNKSQNLTLWEIFSELLKELQNINSIFVKNFENSYVVDFFSLVTDYIENNPGAKLKDFIEYLEVYIEIGGVSSNDRIAESNQNAVQLMTIHSSKGLEFPYVFIIGLVSRRFPSTDKEDSISFPDALMKEALPLGDYHIQEERRLFYVAITRAKKQLFLSCVEKKGSPASIFIKDIRNMNISSLIEEIKIQSNKNCDVILSAFSNNLKNIAQKEIDYFPKEFSYTQLEVYDKCPLRYKFSFLYHIPVPTNSTFMFGIIVHSILQEYYLRVKEGISVNWDSLESIFEEKWTSKGFKTSWEAEKNKEIAKEQIKKFYEKNKDLNPKPVMLEQKFKIDVFGIKIIGRIDRIDELSSDKRVEVIDYKTGKAKTQKDVDKDLQLSIYAIACQEMYNFTPSFLSFYYISTNQKITTTRDDKQLLETKNKIKEIIEKIYEKDFSPSPSSFKCGFCEYKDLCAYSI